MIPIANMVFAILTFSSTETFLIKKQRVDQLRVTMIKKTGFSPGVFQALITKRCSLSDMLFMAANTMCRC